MIHNRGEIDCAFRVIFLCFQYWYPAGSGGEGETQFSFYDAQSYRPFLVLFVCLLLFIQFVNTSLKYPASNPHTAMSDARIILLRCVC